MKPKQRSIGVDDSLWASLDTWLLTEDAKKRGFHSKSQFANFALGEYLAHYQQGILANTEVIKKLTESDKTLRQQIERQMHFIAQLERFWFKNRFPDIET